MLYPIWRRGTHAFAALMVSAITLCAAEVSGQGTAIFPAPPPAQPFAPGPITVRDGVLFHRDGREVALWGVNYEFNLSWEYRTYFEPLGVPLTIEALREIADRDFEELTALGVQAVRAHLLPADFTDAQGNLVDTVFLQALDYLVARCRAKGIYVYLALFNRMGNDYRKDSFAAGVFGPHGDREKSPYLFAPALVDAYEHYVRLLLQRRNPLTGVRYADEPAIAIWELMNEPEFPTRASLDQDGFAAVRADWNSWCQARGAEDTPAMFRRYRYERVRAFLDRFHGAIRDTGARAPVFWTYNWPGFIDQHPEVAEAVRDSRIDGVSFCLYPGQNDLPQPIDHRHLPSLAEKNYLPMLQPEGVDWSEIRRTRESGKAIIVYEFETWCNDSAYLYPAMARLFRELGAQIACMWEYDPAIAADRNMVASHFLNLRSSPAKAASFLVAGEVFGRYPRARRLPGEQLGAGEFRFGPFGVSHPANTSWFVGEDTLAYSRSLPSAVGGADLPAREWRSVTGTGASPVIAVTGNGLYRLERTPTGYRLEVWPDVELLGDLWRNVWDGPTPKKIRLSDEPRTVTLKLRDWTGDLQVEAVSPSGPVGPIIARNGEFSVPPGIYLITRRD